jgi:KaiC/GvpD/RAD55 family RecA-like ATPase
MSRFTTIDYGRIGKENLERAMVRRECHKLLNEALKDRNDGAVIVLEASAEDYLEANVNSIQYLVNNGFEGIYVSFQRPFKNISSLFTQKGIDLNKILIVDGASAFSGDAPNPDNRCVSVPQSPEVDDIVNTIQSSLPRLNGDKKFVFVDSLTTMALHQPENEALRFPEFLINSIRRTDSNKVSFLFNVEKELIYKRYIENLSVYADEHIHLGLCT